MSNNESNIDEAEFNEKLFNLTTIADYSGMWLNQPTNPTHINTSINLNFILVSAQEEWILSVLFQAMTSIFHEITIKMK